MLEEKIASQIEDHNALKIKSHHDEEICRMGEGKVDFGNILRHNSKHTSGANSCQDSTGLRLGFLLGCLVVLVTLVVSLILVQRYSSSGIQIAQIEWPATIRLYRAPLVLSLFLFQAGLSLIIWRRYKINYAHIFQLDEKFSLPHRVLLELGALLGILWSLASLFHWLADLLPASLGPLLLVLIVIVYLINPIDTCHRRERFWMLQVLGRIATAPFHRVQFADYWIADQFVSMVPLFLDLEFTACHYYHYATIQLASPDSEQCASRNHPHLLIRSLIAVAPAWLRVCQCIRISRDENWRPHQLFNALKYGSMIYVISLSMVANIGDTNAELDSLKILWFASSTIVSCIAAGWDMIYDFGVFESLYAVKPSYSTNGGQDLKANEQRWPLLRKQLTFPAWFYYFAIIEDWILKFGWLIFLILFRVFSIEAEVALTLTTLTDLFSKFVWNVIKIENECRLRLASSSNRNVCVP